MAGSEAEMELGRLRRHKNGETALASALDARFEASRPASEPRRGDPLPERIGFL